MTSPFATCSAAKAYALAGRATLTVVSKATGARFTYKIEKGKPKKDQRAAPWFVSVLTGPSNTEDYTLLGMIFEEMTEALRFPRHQRISENAPSARAFRWAWSQLQNPSDQIHPSLEVWHEGRCGRCRRPLTTPESLITGIGPICAEKAAA